MAVPAPGGTKYNFNPESYEAPKFTKDKDGNYDPSTYQTAAGFRKFMHDNNLPFMSNAQVREAANKGTVTLDDKKVIQVNDQDRAMFLKLREDGLFNRLDAGTTHTQDGWVGIQDINDAIKNRIQLHGSKAQNMPGTEGKLKITQDEAKQTLLDQMQKHEIDYFTPRTIDSVINYQNHRSKDGSPVDADPRYIQALMMLGKEYDNVNTNGDHYIDADEIKNWKTKA
jgi:hypothetical protein